MQRFRPAVASDIDAIIAMMRRYYAEDGYPFVETDARQAVIGFIQDETLGQLWTLLDSNRVIGYLAVALGFSLEYRGRDAFLDELFIAEEARGQGLGHKALEIAEAYCREHGVKALHLEVERHRKAAYELYRRNGFEVHNRYFMTKLFDRPGC